MPERRRSVYACRDAQGPIYGLHAVHDTGILPLTSLLSYSDQCFSPCQKRFIPTPVKASASFPTEN